MSQRASSTPTAVQLNSQQLATLSTLQDEALSAANSLLGEFADTLVPYVDQLSGEQKARIMVLETQYNRRIATLNDMIQRHSV